MNLMRSLFIFFILLSIDCFNYSYMQYQENTALYATKFIGRDSSQFTPETFILKMLYGRTDVGFTLQDLYNNLTTTKWWYAGNLLIAIDLSFAGIILDQGKVIAPKPSQKVSLLNMEEINSLCPNGFLIKESNYTQSDDAVMKILSGVINGIPIGNPLAGSLITNHVIPIFYQ